jgi:hypothetical protein
MMGFKSAVKSFKNKVFVNQHLFTFLDRLATVACGFTGFGGMTEFELAVKSFKNAIKNQHLFPLSD